MVRHHPRQFSQNAKCKSDSYCIIIIYFDQWKSPGTIVPEAMTKLKNHSVATGMRYPIDRRHLEYPLLLQRDICNNARKEVHLYNDVRDYTPQPHVI